MSQWKTANSHGPGAVPRDPEDQQASGSGDPYDVDPAAVSRHDEESAEDVPDTDEAGTGRRGSPRTPGVRPGAPVPQEPTD
jgi:hypothetical protein